FQAEDGIRDLIVTGVQTCALPISKTRLCCCQKINLLASTVSSFPDLRPRITSTRRSDSGKGKGLRRTPFTTLKMAVLAPMPSARSEERRVGKEGRCRRWREHSKKK